MTMRDKILSILSGLRPEYDFSESTDFIEDGMLDSFDVVSLVTELEDNFDIIIDGENIIPENFSTIEAIESLIEKSDKN